MTILRILELVSVQLQFVRDGQAVLQLLVESDLSEFVVPIVSSSGASVAMLRFVRAGVGAQLITGRSVAHFELVEVLPAGSLVLCQQVSLSGALWTRQAALEGLSEALISLAEQGLSPRSLKRSLRGGSHHES